MSTYSNSQRNSLLESDKRRSEKYYTFVEDKKFAARSGLHVIDADHGVFDSKLDKRKHHLFSPKNVINKFKANPEKRIHLFPDSDELGLRPEPELLDPLQSRGQRSRFSITREVQPQQSRIPDIPIFSVEDKYDSDTEDRRFTLLKSSSVKKSSKSDTSQKPKFNLSRKSNSSKSEELLPNFIKDVEPITSAELSSLHKSKVELEYEQMKQKAMRYKAERDSMYAKARVQELSEQLRNYEYYFVNGIKRSDNDDLLELETDDDYINSSYRNQRRRKDPKPFYALPSPPLPREIQGKISTRSRKNNLIEDNKDKKYSFGIIDQVSPEVAQIFNYYANYIPTNGTVREIHKVVMMWVYTLPGVNFIYPLLLVLKMFIPSRSREKSFKALGVLVLDSVILIVYGWISFFLLKRIIPYINTFIRLIRFLISAMSYIS